MLPDFVKYLAGVWQNRNRYVDLSDDEASGDEQEVKLHKQRFFDFTYDGKVSARNYVGVVQYNDIRIEVFPKIFSDDAEENATKWQLNLLYWLMYCRKIKFPFSFADVSKMEFDDYLELLIYIFANYTEETISRQPFQAYQTVEEETVFLKGRLMFDNYTKHHLTTGKWQNFYCSYEPFVYDNLFNRIIKYVTRRLLLISRNHLNKEKLNEILFLLDDVSDVHCTAADCDRVKLNPLFEQHMHILDLCKLYLSNQVIDLDTDDSRNFCFLVPMEYIFEDFVFGFVHDKWPQLNIRSQSTDYLAVSNGQKVFQIKNDMYVPGRLIIDTKYKVRYADGSLKAGVGQNDIYQMVSYAVKRNCKDVLLLYPEQTGALNTPSQFSVISPMLNDELNIHVRNIDITFDDIQRADIILYSRFLGLHEVFQNY